MRAAGMNSPIIAAISSGMPTGLFRDMRAEPAQADVVRGVEHPAVGIAAAVDEILARLLGRGGEHDRSGEALGQDGRRPFGTEVAQEETRALTPAALISSRALRTSFSFSTTVGISAMLIDFLRHSSATRMRRFRDSSMGKQSRLTPTRPSLTVRNVVHEVSFFLSVISLRSVFAQVVFAEDMGGQRPGPGSMARVARAMAATFLQDEGVLDGFGRGSPPGEGPWPATSTAGTSNGRRRRSARR